MIITRKNIKPLKKKVLLFVTANLVEPGAAKTTSNFSILNPSFVLG